MRGCFRVVAASICRRLDAVANFAAGWRPNRGGLLARIAGKPFPVFLTAGGAPCLCQMPGPTEERAVVCSIPKAGTYLLNELLQTMGLVSARIHLGEEGFSDYRFASLETARSRYAELDVRLPLADTVQLLLPGQFAVGHLRCRPEVRDALGSIRKVFAYRDLRDCVVSWMRFIVDAGRVTPDRQEWASAPDGPARLEKMLDSRTGFDFDCVREMTEWRRDPDVLSVCYETLLRNPNTAESQGCISALADFLMVPTGDVQSASILPAVLSRQTLTKSAKPTDWREYWDDRVEAAFRARGGVEINRNLGYPQ